MSWYATASDDFERRSMVLVDNTAGGGAATNASISVAADWEGWAYVRSAGQDVRVTAADGVTAVTYDLESFDSSTRTGTIEVNGLSVTAGRLGVLWVYYGNATVADGQSSITLVSPVTGYLFPGAPVARGMHYTEEPQGATRPTPRFTKRVQEAGWIAVSFASALYPAQELRNDRQDYEELSEIVVDVQTGGSSQSSLFDATKTRGLGKATILVWVKAGSADTTYTGIVRAYTNLGRVLEARFLLAVQNDTEQ